MGNCVKRETGIEIEDEKDNIESMEKFRKALILMKKKEIKNQNYESNEKRMKEDKIWSEFNDSGLRPSTYGDMDDEDGEFPQSKFSRKNSIQAEFMIKNFNEEDCKRSKSKLNPDKYQIEFSSRPSIPSNSRSNLGVKIRKFEEIEIFTKNHNDDRIK